MAGNCLPLERQQLNTNAVVQAINARLAAVAATGTRDELNQLSTNLGFNYEPESVRQDTEFALIDVFVWDFMHCYFASGIFDKEMEEFFRRLKLHKSHEVGAEAFYNYSQLFRWPRAYASGHQVCRPSASGSDYEPSGTASEFLSVAPVLARYIRRVVQPSGLCVAETKSMLALCDVAGVLVLAMRGRCEPATLEATINLHLGLRKIAYGDTLWRPKAHFATHLPDHLGAHGFLPACFVQERKHKILKRYAN